MEPQQIPLEEAQKRIGRGRIFLVSFKDHIGAEQTRALSILGLVTIYDTPGLDCRDCCWLPVVCVTRLEPLPSEYFLG
jgi:hypothetical protein